MFNIFSQLGTYEDDFLFGLDFCCLYFWINQIFVKERSEDEACVVEVYTTKFSNSLFLQKLYENLMSIEIIYCNESQKLLSQQHFQ